ncbi:hypothetical protein KKF91_12535 [Myxococcota bacterium]|nr:hypothetical protein [Myxococcota bacterium]
MTEELKRLLEEGYRRAKEENDKMNSAEKKADLHRHGILDKDGRVAEVYRRE